MLHRIIGFAVLAFSLIALAQGNPRQRLVKEVGHELRMLPYYPVSGVFKVTNDLRVVPNS
jgi:hypothetical protein